MIKRLLIKLGLLGTKDIPAGDYLVKISSVESKDNQVVINGSIDDQMVKNYHDTLQSFSESLDDSAYKERIKPDNTITN